MADELLAYIDASPTPYHAVAEAARLLEASGSTPVELTERFDGSGRHHLVRDGALIAWSAQPGRTDRPFQIIGAHTDSPNLRVKPRPDIGRAGCRQLAVEPYGGLLANSWLDRDLGLAGRVSVRAGRGIEQRLFRDDRPLLRVPQLAIHLDRDVNQTGLILDPSRHLSPVWGLGQADEGDFGAWLAEAVGVPPDDVLGWDVMCHDTLPAGFLGVNEELISAPRLDNLCSCFAAVRALAGLGDRPSGPQGTGDSDALVVLFDHEEVGSTSSSGAAAPLLRDVIDLIGESTGAGGAYTARVLARSWCLSADMAHATHPNYPERHDPEHRVDLGGGPVVKVNVNQRYATDGATAAMFREVCRRAGVPSQTYSHRNDLPCGSTIGPLVAAGSGVRVVDVGAPQLSMHSARELMATADVALICRAFEAWLAG